MILTDSKLDYGSMRKIVMDVLKDGFNQYGNICSGVGTRLIKQKLVSETSQYNMAYSSSRVELSQSDEDKVNQIVWDLIIERVLTIGLDSVNNSWPFLRLTLFGKKILESEETAIVYDADGMIELLNKKIPNVDQVIERYLIECINTIRIDALLASSVMLGCAAEKGIHLLFDAYFNWLKLHGSQKECDNLFKHKNHRISSKFDALTESIRGHKPDIESNLFEDYDLLVSSIFTLIRRNRNDAGHPTGKSIEKYELITMVYAFINHCKKIYDLIKFFESGLK